MIPISTGINASVHLPLNFNAITTSNTNKSKMGSYKLSESETI